MEMLSKRVKKLGLVLKCICVSPYLKYSSVGLGCQEVAAAHFKLPDYTSGIHALNSNPPLGLARLARVSRSVFGPVSGEGVSNFDFAVGLVSHTSNEVAEVSGGQAKCGVVVEFPSSFEFVGCDRSLMVVG